ncbi:MAG: hypothetical protein JOY90_36635 [Bradyrhizobium sp.]|uniref:hypothetical protein n=1 Tax=Bradyrhizobium sp. TaxID=376 RepID=UPI001D507516|nr:hypothetical protein [Bradyrhizobium sp.]MBV9565940.1 hypothetical protein [Bradyrhizobium sp.]
MQSTPRMISLFAAAGIAAMLSGGAPAIARDPVAASDAVRAAFAMERHHLHLPVRGALPRYVHRVAPECTGAWCGRQFVLMLGIGY